MRHLRTVLPFLLVLSLVATACSNNGGAPSSPGQYPVQQGSVHFDGSNYDLYWADQGGTLHRMQTHNLRLVQDPNATYLEVPQGGGDPILHMRQDEPITVNGRDNQGSFGSPWFPFLVGATLGNVLGGGRGGQTVIINNPAPGESRGYDPSTPAYRYPPTGSFGRDDELHGSLDTSKPQPPDYSKVQPAPYATSGKTSGSGGGTAISNKTSSSSSSSAATGKGGFANSSSSSSSVGAGSKGVLPKTSTGSTGSKGIGSTRAPSVGRR